jgi:hypothetical protein
LKAEDVLTVLRELGGKASIRDITQYAKNKRLHKDFAHVIKVRDSLIRLKRRGLVDGDARAADYLDVVWRIREKHPADCDL